MVATYTIMGRQVGSHYLAMATLGTTGLVSYLSMSGGSKKEQGPALNATSKDEEKFINEFMEKAEAEAKKAKH